MGVTHVPFRAQQPEQARRPPAPTAKHRELRSAAGAVRAATPLESRIESKRSGTERRARTTAAGRRRAAPNGTSGVLAYGKHASRGGLGHAANHSCGAPCPIGDLVFPT
jgi:hypothetical protein